MKLREALQRCGLTQADAAEALGVTVQALSRWAQPIGADHHRIPKGEHMAALFGLTKGLCGPADFFADILPSPRRAIARERVAIRALLFELIRMGHLAVASAISEQVDRDLTWAALREIRLELTEAILVAEQVDRRLAA